jgi:hypothetical protein
VIDRVGKMAALARSLLLDTRPLEVTPSKVVIGFDPEFAKNRERMQTSHYLQALQSVLTQTLRRPVNVELRLIQPDGPRVDVPADHAAGEQEKHPPAAPAKGTRQPADWTKDPVVRKALEIFNGTIVDIRE